MKTPSAVASRRPAVKLPNLTVHRVGVHEYGCVKWRGRRYLLGRRDDPNHLVEFQQFCDAILRTGQPPVRSTEPPPDFSVADLCASYLEHAEIYYRHQADQTPTASIDRIKQAMKPLLAKFGTLAAEDFSLQMLRLYRSDLLARKLSRVTINGKVGVLKLMFQWGAEEQLVTPEVAARLKLLRPLQRGRSLAIEPPPRQPVEWKTVEATLPYLPRPVRGLLLTMWHTAMRVGEAAQICSRHVDMTGEVWVFRPLKHKTLHHGKSREIDIGKAAQAVLREFVQLDPDRPWFSPKDAMHDYLAARRAARKTKLHDAHVLHMEKKRKVDPQRAPRDHYDCRSVAQSVEKAVATANSKLAEKHKEDAAAGEPPQIPNWSSHQLRHAALTRIRKEFGLESALAVGGHGSFTVTEGYTQTARRQLARDVMLKIG